jgi:surface carbohydrate biosynthesis protein
MAKLAPLLIPVENQVRELDPKLLLAIVAAEAGFKSYLGYRTEMDIIISSFPRGIYLAKSFTERSNKMFNILSKLGHTICAWDEEALVHYPPDIYFTRRLSANAISHIQHLFAWGKDNEQLFRSYDYYPEDLPIHTVGNPRLDLLRPEFKPFYADEIKAIQQEHGGFILFNTNFGNVNAHLPIHNLFINKDKDGSYKDIGKGAVGMGYEFAAGCADYKQTIFDNYLALIEYISHNLADMNLVIRPHPVENLSPYLRLAEKYTNIQVVRRGNVIPWIHASKTLVHSGCTTAIESYLSKKLAIAYMPIKNDRYGYGAILPNQLSIQCETPQQVLSAITDADHGDLTQINTNIINDYINLNENKLCSTNIIEKLQVISSQINNRHSYQDKAQGWLLANKRKLIKRTKSYLHGSKYHKSFQEVRFPSLQQKTLQNKAEIFANIVGMSRTPDIKQVSPHIFLVE